MEPTKFVQELPDWTLTDRKRVDGLAFLELLKRENEEEYQRLEAQDQAVDEATQTAPHAQDAHI